MRGYVLGRLPLTVSIILAIIAKPAHAYQAPTATDSTTLEATLPPDVAAGARGLTQEKIATLQNLTPGDSQRPVSEETRQQLLALLQTRLKTLDAFDRAIAARERAEHPTMTTAQEQSNLDDAVKRLTSEQNAPEPHLPDAFRPQGATPISVQLDSMRDAISAAKEALKETIEDAETLRTELHQQSGGRLVELKTQRDELHQKLDALMTSKTAIDTELSATADTEARQIAREKTLNLALEIRVVYENLQAVDLQIPRVSELTRLSELRLTAQALRESVERRRLHAMQALYQALADRQRRILETAASNAVQRALGLKDPIEYFRAKRGATLLSLQALLLNEERELSATPLISGHEQERLTREASEDLENLRSLIEGGRSTTLVALRLTNSYRRIAQQRESLVSRELASATAVLTRYENLLTSVELDILNDSREDLQEYEAMLGQIPASRHRQARETFEQIEEQHRMLLESRRKVLTTLAKHAEKTREAILRRIGILDEQYAYIRTHIFWVRDNQPIGLATFRQCHEDVRSSLVAVTGLARSRWQGRVASIVTAEFVLVGSSAVFLPLILFRVRRLLVRRLAALYGPSPTIQSS